MVRFKGAHFRIISMIRIRSFAGWQGIATPWSDASVTWDHWKG